MTLEQRLDELAQAIGTDIATLLAMVGLLASLTTTAKGSVVAAINELKSRADNQQQAFQGLINDTAGQGDTAHVFSADHVLDLLADLEVRILGDMPPAMLDTLKELADYLTDNTVVNGVVQQLSQRIRVDAAQAFNTTQQAQGRSNIGAASAAGQQALADAVAALQQQVADAAVKEIYAQALDPVVTAPSINFQPDATLGVSFLRIFVP